MMELEGQVALVTGASRGIGQAILKELARQGATVVGTATGEAGVALIEQSLKDVGGKGAGRVLDVKDGEGIIQAVEEIKAQFGPISILVNNAGITRDTLSMRMSDDAWDEVLDTNLKSVFRASRAVLRDMMKARAGRIINIGSVVGTLGNAGQCNYSAAKAGLLGLTKSLARELASRGVTVNLVAPGFIETDMTRALEEPQRQALMSAIPLGRLGTPEDVAWAVSWLASPRSAWVTGETVHVNGGMLMD